MRARPGLRAWATAAGALVVALAASGCVSTEQQSARIARSQARVQGTGTVHLTGANASVRVLQATLLRGGGRTAAALQLVNDGPAAQVDVPLLIDVTTSSGRSLYRNDTAGLQPSLQQLASVAPGRPVWWVDDQVLAPAGASAVHVTVGRATPSRGAAVPAIAVTGVSVGSLDGLTFVNGTAVNHSGVAQSQLPVFAVAVRDGRVVAAGRALIPALGGAAGAQAPFRIFPVGRVAGAHVEVTVAPTRLR